MTYRTGPHGELFEPDGLIAPGSIESTPMPVNRPALPTFEEIRRRARARLSDARDELNSDTTDGLAGRVTTDQARAVADALEHIGRAKAALDRAAR